MWQLVSSSLLYRWRVVGFAWLCGLSAGLQTGLRKAESFSLTTSFALVFASAIVGATVTYLERREHRAALVPLLVIGRAEVAAARALLPPSVLALGTLAAATLCAVDAAVRSDAAILGAVLVPVPVAAQLLPYMQLPLLGAELRAARLEGRRRDEGLTALALAAGFLIPLTVNLGGLAGRWAGCGIEALVGCALSLTAAVVYQHRRSLAV